MLAAISEPAKFKCGDTFGALVVLLLGALVVELVTCGLAIVSFGVKSVLLIRCQSLDAEAAGALCSLFVTFMTRRLVAVESLGDVVAAVVVELNSSVDTF